ncbi:triple tyrosine motif-containing protein [Christiangramia salexigens]|uniref:Histidine kinase n=1 Tax=Christiangramia salexigens TaxID=1913577 RepID=A0A1L3J6C6_9FLAO|nr:triple tyrosine motif-containing protein [Christiangramia salexigens]APG60666.1 histidine kinase [Christiangramia salexigens]
MSLPRLKNLVLYAIVAFFFSFGLEAQELPPVMNFGPNQYNAGNQNWMISRADNNNFYFANSAGLLEYTGEDWNLYPVPNETIVRSVKVMGKRIYTGAYMEAGYWERNDFGKLKYTSLTDKFPGGLNDGEQIWEIVALDDLVIFRSFAAIYFFDAESGNIKTLENKTGNPISGIFQLGGQIYFQMVGEGLFQIKNGEPHLSIPFSKLRDRAVIHLFNRGEDLAMVLGNSEFLVWNEGELKNIYKSLSTELQSTNILSALNFGNSEIFLGTVGQGILHIDENGNLINSFNQENILGNNTVLDLYMDESGMIWAGLDYGLALLDPLSNFRSFSDNKGKIGSVYTSFVKDGNLYLGTNQGLYVKDENDSEFELIPGTNGQVWFINEVDGRIYCGHNNGTFLIEEGNVRKISDRLGTWLVKKYDENIYIQGHYNGISFLKEKDGEITEIPMMPEFPHSSKFIEIGKNKEVWISNEHKGVYRLKFNDSLTQISELKNYKFPKESGVTSSIFKFNDSLYYSSREKIYQYKIEADSFSLNNRINELIKETVRISGKMQVTSDNRLWGFSDESILYIQSAQLSKDYELKHMFIPQSYRNIAIGYENIFKIDDAVYLLGVANGYLKFNDPEDRIVEPNIKLDEISISSLDSETEYVSLNKSGEFAYQNNNLIFKFSTPVYNKYQKAFYSYRLVGQSSKWSDWEKTSEAAFKNLPFGDYTFQVRAKVGNEVSDIVEYDFTIKRPLALSNLAIIAYAVLFLIILFVVNKLYKRNHEKKLAENEQALRMKNLEAEQEIIKLRNEKLEQEMEGKSRELAVSTMSLIKKNEFLTSIKDQLKESSGNSVRSVIRTIDKDINEEDNWKFFKKAFSNADKEFFQKIKSKHPELTSNDLKLCAYLRLNLSSKEIAPLLNISVKSVEIKRYRLRKKMDLDRETNLTEYILDI